MLICEKCNNEFERKNKQRFCSKNCQKEWQSQITWEERIGKQRAKEIRQKRSKQVSGENNPSCRPEVSQKISESLKTYLIKNPRIGELNHFFSKKHSDETKKHLSESKKGKWAYTSKQYELLCQNSLSGENHPNWKGGTSFEPYSKEWTKKLKTHIKQTYDNKCLICNKNNVRLAVHHIDYNKKNCTEQNLIPLCYSCHSKTNYNRDSWIKVISELILLYKELHNEK